MMLIFLKWRAFHFKTDKIKKKYYAVKFSTLPVTKSSVCKLFCERLKIIIVNQKGEFSNLRNNKQC